MRNMIQHVSIGRISQQAAIARSNECTDAEKLDASSSFRLGLAEGAELHSNLLCYPLGTLHSIS